VVEELLGPEVTLPDPFIQQIVLEAEAAPDEEICGVLLGEVSENLVTVTEIVPCANVATEKLALYVPDPETFYATLARTTLLDRTSNLSFIGIYHSHPHSLPIPSKVDLDFVGYQGWYLIVSPRYKSIKLYQVSGVKGEPWELIQTIPYE
jgi:proteasome lid subunit RPN8/RPN11